MSYDPVQRCTSTEPHGPHVWNVHESMVPSMRAQNPHGYRQCPGVKDIRALTAGEAAYLRQQMDVYLRPHLPTTRDTATTAPTYKRGGPPRPLWADLMDTP